jgi:hypothetical protein
MKITCTLTGTDVNGNPIEVVAVFNGTGYEGSIDSMHSDITSPTLYEISPHGDFFLLFRK